MKVDYTEGLAFILEGATEKVFYKNLLISSVFGFEYYHAKRNGAE